MKAWLSSLVFFSATAFCAGGEVLLEGNQPALYTGIYNPTTEEFESLNFVNSVTGWDTFFQNGYLGSGRIIANVEAGLVWAGHDVFQRPVNSPSAVSTTLAGTGALLETDFHATMVGHVLAGTGYVSGSSPEQFTYVGLGMAPLAQIWSGAIATSYSPTKLGSFETTTASTVSVYRTFFQGINGVKPDVINSSWGGADPSAASAEMVAIDGLAKQNPTVAFVVSAGNGDAAPVSAPGSTYNSITVGSLGGPAYLDPSAFSSRGRVDFFNPVTGVTLIGVRSAVDLAAPGENFILAANLGGSGSIGASTDPEIMNIVQDPSPTDRYFLPQSGTSFSAPVVAGGIALLKDFAANAFFVNLNGIPTANDTRVIKSVLMAGATRTNGWNNGQALDGQGAIITTQALDEQTGAGALNLDQALNIYVLSGTRDLTGTAGGSISDSGWDFASVATEGSNDYLFTNPFTSPVELTVSLNWFAGRTFDNIGDVGVDGSFVDLNLEVWRVTGGVFSTLVAQSTSQYNNAEFLRLDLPEGDYGFRVTFYGLVYETVEGSTTGESYGLAWNAQAIPEPATVSLLLLLAGVALIVRFHRCSRRN